MLEQDFQATKSPRRNVVFLTAIPQLSNTKLVFFLSKTISKGVFSGHLKKNYNWVFVPLSASIFLLKMKKQEICCQQRRMSINSDPPSFCNDDHFAVTQ